MSFVTVILLAACGIILFLAGVNSKDVMGRMRKNPGKSKNDAQTIVGDPDDLRTQLAFEVERRKLNEIQILQTNQHLRENEEELMASVKRLQEVHDEAARNQKEREEKERSMEMLHKASVDQELLLVRLKQEVNALLKRLGEEVKYKAVEEIDPDELDRLDD